jgi:hypothetical protein
MSLLRLCVVVAFSVGISAGQTPAQKSLEPDSIGVFYYLDSSTQTLKRLPSEEWKRHNSGSFSISQDIVVSGTTSPFHVAADGKATFVFKVFKDEDAGKVKLYQFTVKGKDREYELGKWKRRDFTPNTGVSLNVTKFGEASYQLSSETPLAPGEYALASGQSMYTFSVQSSGR